MVISTRCISFTANEYVLLLYYFENDNAKISPTLTKTEKNSDQ